MSSSFSIRALIGSLVLAAAAAPAQPPRVPAGDGWRDQTAHRQRFITVSSDVRLHTLDFGGAGPPLLFLAGLGNTAHAWDNFATRFTDRFRVYAFTRRGFGESSHPDGELSINLSGYATDETQAALDRGRGSDVFDERRTAYTDFINELNTSAVNIWLYITPNTGR